MKVSGFCVSLWKSFFCEIKIFSDFYSAFELNCWNFAIELCQCNGVFVSGPGNWIIFSMNA